MTEPAQSRAEVPFRIGLGWDSHCFTPGRPLWLGGVRIAHDRGLAGHSDGDVLLHAVCDALLGAVALGDIGEHFPSTGRRWKNAASARFVRHALALVRRAGWRVSNLDATLILERPRMGPLRPRLRARLAALLGIDAAGVSIKAKTPEGMGAGNAAFAHVVVLLARAAARPAPARPARRRARRAA